MPGTCISCSAPVRYKTSRYCRAPECKRARDREYRARHYARHADTPAVVPAEKRCSGCGEVKPSGEFWKSARASDGLQWHCKLCNSAKSGQGYRRRTYGLDPEKFAALREAQGYRCAVCGRHESDLGAHERDVLVVDHCHDTGEVRGLLCSMCNRGIGFLRDDPNNLLAAAAYLLSSQDVLYRGVI